MLQPKNRGEYPTALNSNCCAAGNLFRLRYVRDCYFAFVYMIFMITGRKEFTFKTQHFSVCKVT